MDVLDAEAAKYYLYDLCRLIREYAEETKRERDAARPGSAKRNLLDGMMHAYYRMFTLMQQQATGFGIPSKPSASTVSTLTAT